MSRPSFAAVDSDGFPLPVLPVPPMNSADRLRSGAWENIPAVRDFTRESSGDCLLIFRSECRTAYDGENLCLRFTGFDPEIDGAVMTPEYSGWFLDDAVDFYITGGDGVLHQLVFNAAGGRIYFQDMALGGAMDPPPEISGSRDASGWTAILKLPLAAFGLRRDETLRIKIMRNAPREFLHHASGWGADAGGRPGVVLKFLDAPMSADECRRAELELNRGRRERLMRLHADARTAAKLRALPPAAQEAAEAFLAGLTAPAEMREGEAQLARIAEFIRLHKDAAFDRTLVDFGAPSGTIRLLNGTNDAPPLSGRVFRDRNDDFAALRIPSVRFHDDALTNPGMRLVDATLIFHRPDADPSDPANYYFTQTDDYVANCLSLGSRIIYRLGASIEHSLKKYFVKAPADYAQFAEICAGIVRHYNAGWADGFHYGINHWEIWNEPDLGPAMWDRTLEDYYEMYAVVAKRLKSEFPDIRIGGPAATTMNPAMMKNFLTRCREKGAPVDFISWHRYGKNPEEFVNQAKIAALIAADCGFDDAEFHLNEWHYLPDTFTNLRSNPEARKRLLSSPEGVNGIDSAAFNTTVLTRWQDTPLTMSNFYMTVGSWGFYDPYGAKYPTYDSFLAFAPFADHRQRVRACSGEKGLSILAGRDGGDGGMILISAFRMPERTFTLTVRGLGNASVRVNSLEDGHGLAEHRDYTLDGEVMTLTKHSDSAIFQILVRGLRDSAV